jgi:conjugative relaxase-like TrwC/TraI family protein
MLRNKWHTDAAAAKTYFQLSDYHRPVAGEWIGRDAERLGLTGQAREDDFDKVLGNVNPLTGAGLTTHTRDGRRVAWELNFNAVKDASVAGEIGGDRNQGDPRVEWAHREAVRYTLGLIERDMQARVRDGGQGDGKESRTTGGMIAWRTTHKETRVNEDDLTPDPDYHDHVLIMNATFDPVAKKWKAIENGKIARNLPLYEAAYHSRMACLLRAEGYGIAGRGKSYQLTGFSDELRDLFSRRTRTIKQRQQEREEKLGRALTAEEADQLGAKTRLGKTDLAQDELRGHWLGKLTDGQKRQLASLKGQPSAPCGVAEAVGYAIEHEFYRRAVVSEAKLYETAIRRGMGWVASPDEVKEECRRQGVLVKDGQATTAALRRQEREFCAIARGGLGKCRPLVAGPVDLGRLLAPAPGQKPPKPPTDEQAGVLRALAGSRSRINVVDAGQGTGKTTLLGHYATILKRRGQRATWLGTTHTAVDQLTAQGLPAMTVASFLKSTKEQQKAAGSRIILDESSMLAHGDAYRLAVYARDHGCRIDFVGDSRQYKAPVAGDPMTLLARHGGVKPFTMSRTMRQQGRLKEAMEAIRDGDVLGGHDILTELGMVRETPLDRLTQTAADTYLNWTARGGFVPVISPTHAQADDIAERIRAGLRARGDLTGDDRTVRRLVDLQWSPAQLKDAKKHGAGEGIVLTRYGAYRDDTQALAAGDLVRTTMGGKTKDGKHALKNGQRYRVNGFTRGGDIILSNGWVVDKNWGGLVQRYVSTGQGAQGITADPRAIAVYGTPSLVATRREGYYVPVSRVRQEVAVLTDSVAALREAIQRQDDRTFATDLFPDRTARPGPTLRQRLGRHLAWVRRQAAFARTHPAKQPGLPPPERGIHR